MRWLWLSRDRRTVAIAVRALFMSVTDYRELIARQDASFSKTDTFVTSPPLTFIRKVTVIFLPSSDMTRRALAISGGS